jgi:hypothetical protein
MTTCEGRDVDPLDNLELLPIQFHQLLGCGGGATVTAFRLIHVMWAGWRIDDTCVGPPASLPQRVSLSSAFHAAHSCPCCAMCANAAMHKGARAVLFNSFIH